MEGAAGPCKHWKLSEVLAHTSLDELQQRQKQPQAGVLHAVQPDLSMLDL